MHEAERLSRLIAAVYDAALDRTLWPAVLPEAAEFVGGSACALYSKNTLNLTGICDYDWGLDQDFKRRYFETYVKFDPVTPAQYLFEVGEVFSTVDLISYDEFLETRFYKEWAKPQGLIEHIGTMLDKTTTSFAAFGVFRRDEEGPADQETYRRMRLIVPHIRRAALIGNVIDLHKSEVASLADAFDGLADGVFLVDASARIVFANTAGQAIIDEGSVLRDRGRTLAAVDPQVDRMLRDVFRAALGGDVEVGTQGVAVPLLAAGDDRWFAHILPLTSGARRRAGDSFSATAAVFLRKVKFEAPSPMKLMAKLYKLTPSEIRVLASLIDVGGVPAVAKQLGLSENTVRTHVQHVFEKTDVRRQVDLVTLVAAHTSPLKD
jgi:DNA-binding CsgD family transcriptional regulator/PAS domain-containing protein